MEDTSPTNRSLYDGCQGSSKIVTKGRENRISVVVSNLLETTATEPTSTFCSRVDSPEPQILARELRSCQVLHSSLTRNLELALTAHKKLSERLSASSVFYKLSPDCDVQLSNVAKHITCACAIGSEILSCTVVDKSNLEKLRSMLRMERNTHRQPALVASPLAVRCSPKRIRGRLYRGISAASPPDSPRVAVAEESGCVGDDGRTHELRILQLENARLTSALEQSGRSDSSVHSDISEEKQQLDEAVRDARLSWLEAENLSEIVEQLQRVLRGREKELRVAESKAEVQEKCIEELRTQIGSKDKEIEILRATVAALDYRGVHDDNPSAESMFRKRGGMFDMVVRSLFTSSTAAPAGNKRDTTTLQTANFVADAARGIRCETAVADSISDLGDDCNRESCLPEDRVVATDGKQHEPEESHSPHRTTVGLKAEVGAAVGSGTAAVGKRCVVQDTSRWSKLTSRIGEAVELSSSSSPLLSMINPSSLSSQRLARNTVKRDSGGLHQTSSESGSSALQEASQASFKTTPSKDLESALSNKAAVLQEQLVALQQSHDELERNLALQAEGLIVARNFEIDARIKLLKDEHEQALAAQRTSAAEDQQTLNDRLAALTTTLATAREDKKCSIEKLRRDYEGLYAACVKQRDAAQIELSVCHEEVITLKEELQRVLREQKEKACEDEVWAGTPSFSDFNTLENERQHVLSDPFAMEVASSTFSITSRMSSPDHVPALASVTTTTDGHSYNEDKSCDGDCNMGVDALCSRLAATESLLQKLTGEHNLAIAELRDRVESSEEEARLAKLRVVELNDQLAHSAHSISEAEARYAALNMLRAKLHATKKTLKTTKEEMIRLRTDTEQYLRKISLQDGIISTLRDDVITANSACNDASAELTVRTKELATLKDTIATLTTHISRGKEHVETLEVELATATSAMTRLEQRCVAENACAAANLRHAEHRSDRLLVELNNARVFLRERDATIAVQAAAVSEARERALTSSRETELIKCSLSESTVLLKNLTMTKLESQEATKMMYEELIMVRVSHFKKLAEMNALAKLRVVANDAAVAAANAKIESLRERIGMLVAERHERASDFSSRLGTAVGAAAAARAAVREAERRFMEQTEAQHNEYEAWRRNVENESKRKAARSAARLAARVEDAQMARGEAAEHASKASKAKAGLESWRQRAKRERKRVESLGAELEAVKLELVS